MSRLLGLHVSESRIWMESSDESKFSVNLEAGPGLEALQAAMGQLFDEGALADTRQVDVIVHCPLVQIRTLVDVPKVDAGDLHGLVRHQHSRFFRPIEGEPAVSAAWIDRGEDAVARAAAAPLDLLEGIEDGLGERGVTVRRFIPVNGVDVKAPPIITPRLRATRRRRRLATVAKALALAASGWVAAGTAYVVDLYADGRAIESEMATLAEPLERMDAVAERTAAFAPFIAAADRQAAASEWPLLTLAGLGRSLPADTHVHELSMERSVEVRVDAHGPDPLRAIGELSEWWQGPVRLDGAPQPGEAQGGDDVRFVVVLEWEPR